MPTRYVERLNLPEAGNSDVEFYTNNGLPLAHGYRRVVYAGGKPYVEFDLENIVLENVAVPPNLEWRRKHPEAYYAEYRSRDYCAARIIQQKIDRDGMVSGMWYVSIFDLTSNKYPVLMDRLNKHDRKNG